ncbi:MAG: DEAD/DEAH box helicase [Actinophytocola sp.]|uniref:DEAD/DEAH box helicase n=1 Tax=Actinophytocola sp. TaxID=1872138 RepID=UPI003D6BC686
MPNSTARHNARATKPRHKQARTTQQHPRSDAATKHARTNRDGHPHQAPRRDDHRSAANGRGSWSDNHRDDRSTGTRQGSWSDSPRRRDDRDTRGQARDNRSTGNRRGSWSDNPRRRDDRRDDRGQGRDRRAPWSDDRHAGRPVDRREQAPNTPSWDGEIVEDGRKPVSVSFAELGLPTPLLNALADAGINEPFPIQAATLPDALAGRDVLGRAQTGSGKTLAFGLALLTRLNHGKPRPGHPRGLVLVPTRELAVQVTEALMPLAKSLGLWCRTVVGGMSFSKQADQLQRGIDLLIATPGRLSDHVRQGTCVLDDVRFVTLDEADQMADMGFLPQVRDILDLVPDGQRMLFSATLDRDVAALVDRYLTNPVTHSVSPATATVSTMDHHLLLVSPADKAAVVAEMAAREGRTIMFLRTKHHVDRLTKQLRAVGVRAGALHGGKPQGARNRVLGEFKDGSLPVLVATDVAARGIHVDGVSLVVHVDPPADAKGYLHRAGRTARAGEAGTVVTMVTHQERRTVFRMTEQAGVSPERTTVRPGDADLTRITGARVPSGEPVIDPEPTRRPPRRGNRFDRPRGRFRR